MTDTSPSSRAWLSTRAAAMAQQPTRAEQAFREALLYHTKRLLDRNLRKWTIRFQYPIPPYIPDFVCLERRLIIEVDGGYHDAPPQRARDASRTAHLTRLGYRVLRFRNEAVLHSPQRTMQRIKHFLLDLSDRP